MPEERDIEKQLRAAAEERRRTAGGPFELHPATRRLLQGEVARARGTPAGGTSRKSFFGLTWLRFASGVCTVGVLGFGTWLVIRTPPAPPKHEWRGSATGSDVVGTKSKLVGDLALAEGNVDALKRTEESPAAAPAEGAATLTPPAPTTPAPVVQPAPADGWKRGERSAVFHSADIAKPQAPPVRDLAENKLGGLRRTVAAALPETASVARADKSKDDALVGADHEPAAAPTSLSSVVFAGGTAVSAGEKQTSGFTVAQSRNPVTQSFFYRNETSDEDRSGLPAARLKAEKAPAKPAAPRTRAVLAATSAPPPALLANFEVTQTGERIRIVDGDGSVYEGVLLAEAAFADAAASDVKLRAKESARDIDGGGFSAGSGTTRQALAKKLEADVRFDSAYANASGNVNGTIPPSPGASGPAPAQETAGGIRFNAAGTNLALRQNVVISGTFMNTVPTDREYFSRAVREQSQLTNRSSALPANTRIIGRAVTADGREVRLNAAPVAP